MSKTITISDETYKKIEKQVLEDNKVKEEKKIEIKTFGGTVLYSSSKTTIKEAIIEAVGKSANLEDAYLEGANFYHTKFYGIGGNTRIKKEQINDFLTALGVVAE